MRKILFLLCVLFSSSYLFASFGEFGDGTTPSDTVYMEFATWDSSGHGANADTVCWIRFWHGVKVDSVVSTNATYLLGGRPGVYVLPKPAYSTGKYGQYTVSFWFNYTDKDKRVYQANGYLVRAGNIQNSPKYIGDLRGSQVGDDSVKVIYVSKARMGVYDGLTPSSACTTMNQALTKCTGARQYKIYVGAGNYGAVCCTVSVANVEIIGAGREYVIFDHTAAALRIMLVNITGEAHFSISGTTFDGSALEPPDGVNGVAIADADWFEIHNCNFIHCGRGIDITDGTSYGRIYDNYFFDSYGDGIFNSTDNCLIYDNIIDSLQVDGADGLYLGGGGDQSIAFRNFVRTNQGQSVSMASGLIGASLFDNYSYNDDSSKTYLFSATEVPAFIDNKERSFFNWKSTVQDDLDSLFRHAKAIRNKSDSSSFSVGGKARVDVKMVDGDTASADNLRLIFDGDSTTAARADFKQVTMKAGGVDSWGLWTQGSGVGSGIYSEGGSSGGYGIWAQGKGASGHGLACVGGTSGFGLELSGTGGANFPGLYIASASGGNAVEIAPGTNGFGIEIGGLYGIYFEAEDVAIAAVNADTGIKIKGDLRDVVLVGDGRIHGTLNRVDSSTAYFNHQIALASDSVSIANIVKFLGATPGDTLLFWPHDGSANKDSVQILHNGWKSSVKFIHLITPAVIDTAFTH